MNLLFANEQPGIFTDSWYAATSTPLPRFPALRGDTRADVCIIGAGYTGLSAALHLAQAGLGCRGGRSAWGSALAPPGAMADRWGVGSTRGRAGLRRRLGPGPARALWDLAEDAKSTLRGMIDDNGIDASWRDGVARCCRFDSEVREARDESEMLAQRYDYSQIEAAGSRATTGGVDRHRGLRGRRAGPRRGACPPAAPGLWAGAGSRIGRGADI